jgi:hypothetical protein
MTYAQRTALVVLKPGLDRPVSAERAGETPPDPDTVSRVIGWFRDRGFETGPFVGISFAITGSEQLFHEFLGTPTYTDRPGGELALPLVSLEEIQPMVEAVVVPAPPDFGPGNP